MAQYVNMYSNIKNLKSMAHTPGRYWLKTLNTTVIKQQTASYPNDANKQKKLREVKKMSKVQLN